MTSLYLNQWRFSLLTHVCVTQPQWVNFPHSTPNVHIVRVKTVWYINSLRPSDAIWRQWSWTTLVQVMACCLTAPSHYLNQCWLIIRGVLWHTSESSFAGIAQGIDSGYEFEKDILKNIFKSPRGQWVNASTAVCVYSWGELGQYHIDELVPDSGIINVIAMELLQSCTKTWLLWVQILIYLWNNLPELMFPDLCHQMASLGLNELIPWQLCVYILEEN